jgi:ribosomal protein S18 acetylase RimI-like enzyme
METIQLSEEGSEAEFREISCLHIKEIHHGILPFLGPKLLAELYKALVEIKLIYLWAVKSDRRIIGFLAGTLSSNKRALCLLLRRKSLLVLCLMIRLLSASQSARLIISFVKTSAKHVLSARKDASRPQAELLAIAVDKHFQNSGVGKALMLCFEDSVRKGGLADYCVMTNVHELGSNAFYNAMGFEEYCLIPHHNLILRVYKKQIDKAKKA